MSIPIVRLKLRCIDALIGIDGDHRCDPGHMFVIVMKGDPGPIYSE